MTRQEWRDAQVEKLVELGIDVAVAEKTVDRIVASAPDGADLDQWVSQADPTVSEADVQEARVAWYASDAVPARLKRILDARLYGDWSGQAAGPEGVSDA